MTITLSHQEDVFPIRGVFRISRGARTESRVVTATLTDGPFRGRGECVPYARYGETVESVRDQIASVAGAIAAGADRQGLQALLPPGAARNAVDCAFWDLEAKRAGRRATLTAPRERGARPLAGGAWASVSPSCVAFLSGLLTRDPGARSGLPRRALPRRVRGAWPAPHRAR